MSAYNTFDVDSDDYAPYTCEPLGNGKYRISNVTDDVYIYVDVSGGDITPVTYEVTYNLSNVTSTSDILSLSHDAPFVTTLLPISGYTIDDVVVYMGGAVITDAYNAQTGQVSIRNVTGDVVIIASATFVPPIWDDDDEYVPPIVPAQPEDSGDDTTTIVACAAAAVVAALIAAYLIIDRRR